jgi:hypothetical protein
MKTRTGRRRREEREEVAAAVAEGEEMRSEAAVTGAAASTAVGSTVRIPETGKLKSAAATSVRGVPARTAMSDAAAMDREMAKEA